MKLYVGYKNSADNKVYDTRMRINHEISEEQFVGFFF